MNEETDIVWGMAYRIPTDKAEQVKIYLDYREKNGYTIDYVKVDCYDGTRLENVNLETFYRIVILLGPCLHWNKRKYRIYRPSAYYRNSKSDKEMFWPKRSKYRLFLEFI